MSEHTRDALSIALIAAGAVFGAGWLLQASGSTGWWLLVLSPFALIIAFIVGFAFVSGLMLMTNTAKAGLQPGMDTSNWWGRFSGMLQLSRHMPKLLKLLHIRYDSPQGPIMEVDEGYYHVVPVDIEQNQTGTPFTAYVTRPMLNMNVQDLMEQLDFRPDDGETEGQPTPR